MDQAREDTSQVPDPVQFALDQVNRLCGGGARLVRIETGCREARTMRYDIVAPGNRGVVELEDGTVLGGQNAHAIADLYFRYGQEEADRMVMAEWAEAAEEAN